VGQHEEVVVCVYACHCMLFVPVTCLHSQEVLILVLGATAAAAGEILGMSLPAWLMISATCGIGHVIKLNIR
jgi:hypothetical protein